VAFPRVHFSLPITLYHSQIPEASGQVPIIAMMGPRSQIVIPKKAASSLRLRPRIRPILFSLYQRLRMLL
jgi:hypothetical protein